MRSKSRRIWLVVVALSIVASLAGPSRPALAELTFEVVKSFELAEGHLGSLTPGSDGALYGTSFSGGSFNRGTIFRIDGAGNFTRLHSFNGSDGASPRANKT